MSDINVCYTKTSDILCSSCMWSQHDQFLQRLRCWNLPTPPDMTVSVICDVAAVVETLTWFVSDKFYSGDWDEMWAVN